MVDGRPSIVDQLTRTSDALQKFVREQFKTLMSQQNLENHLPGLLTDQNRVELVLSRLSSMAA